MSDSLLASARRRPDRNADDGVQDDVAEAGEAREHARPADHFGPGWDERRQRSYERGIDDADHIRMEEIGLFGERRDR
jgi:hypothetical protein